MKHKMQGLLEVLGLTALFIVAIAGAVWAGPPGPPVIADAPRVPLGGPEISTVTAAALAAYGIWKARR